jgi:hypothetical protein
MTVFMAESSLTHPLLLRSRCDKRLSVGVGALFFGLAGCATFSTHLTPRPTPEGRMDVQANFDVVQLTEDTHKNNFGPNVEIGARYGINEIVDVGAKVNVFGGEVNSRVLLVGQPGFDLAIVPGVGFTSGELTSGHAQSFITTFSLPVIAGVNFGESVLIFGTKTYVHVALRDATETTNGVTTTYPGEVVLYPGGVVGVSLPIRDNFALFPEVNVLFPYLTDEAKFARPVFQGGVAFQFRSGN